jgi:hypothetical protein
MRSAFLIYTLLRLCRHRSEALLLQAWHHRKRYDNSALTPGSAGSDVFAPAASRGPIKSQSART